MTINNRDKFMDSLWDWGILDGCFGDTKIRPTDVDGLIERNHRYLLLEGKSPGVTVSQGQMITYQHLVQDAPVTVLLIWGEPNVPIKLRVFTRKTDQEFNPADLSKLREIVSEWFRRANSNGHVSNPRKERIANFLRECAGTLHRMPLMRDDELDASCDSLRDRISDLLAEL